MLKKERPFDTETSSIRKKYGNRGNIVIQYTH